MDIGRFRFKFLTHLHNVCCAGEFTKYSEIQRLQCRGREGLKGTRTSTASSLLPDIPSRSEHRIHVKAWSSCSEINSAIPGYCPSVPKT